MQIEGSVCLVTGASRGLGRVFAQSLLEAGAAKVYAGARDPATVKEAGTEGRIVPVRLDITSAAEVGRAADACRDVTILGAYPFCPSSGKSFRGRRGAPRSAAMPAT